MAIQSLWGIKPKVQAANCARLGCVGGRVCTKPLWAAYMASGPGCTRPACHKKRRMPVALTNQQQMFVAEYLKQRCKNAAGAARAAGYSPHTAAAQACHLLKKPEIKRLIESELARMEAELRQSFLFDAMVARDVLHSILNNPGARDGDRLAAARDVLDRSGFKAKDRMDIGLAQKEASALEDILKQLEER